MPNGYLPVPFQTFCPVAIRFLLLVTYVRGYIDYLLIREFQLNSNNFALETVRANERIVVNSSYNTWSTIVHMYIFYKRFTLTSSIG